MFHLTFFSCLGLWATIWFVSLFATLSVLNNIKVENSWGYVLKVLKEAFKEPTRFLIMAAVTLILSSQLMGVLVTLKIITQEYPK